MKVIYECIEMNIIENVVKITHNERGIHVFQEGSSPEEYIFISYELPYTIIADSEGTN